MNEGLLKTLQIPGLNAASALARFDNDEEAYMLLVKAFTNHALNNVNTVKNIAQKIASSQNNEADINSYRIAVHSLKGSNRSIGAEELGDIAGELENAVKENDLALIAAKSLPFAEAEEKLIAALADFINAKPKETPSKPGKDAPDPVILASIRQAAEVYDMAGLREAIEALDAFSYSTHPDLAQWLWEKADSSDFELIAERVASIS